MVRSVVLRARSALLTCAVDQAGVIQLPVRLPNRARARISDSESGDSEKRLGVWCILRVHLVRACVHVRACVRVHVRACVRACACVRVRARDSCVHVRACRVSHAVGPRVGCACACRVAVGDNSDATR